MTLHTQPNDEILPMANIVNIRSATESDLSVLIPFMRENWQKTYPKQYEEDPTVLDKLFDKEKLKKQLQEKNAYIFIATFNDKIVGYSKLLVDQEKDRCFLDKLYIDETYQRQHIGSRLLTYCFKSATELNINTMDLQVEHNNEKAINFYTKFGFKPHTVYKGKIIKDLYPSTKKELYYGIKMTCNNVDDQLVNLLDHSHMNVADPNAIKDDVCFPGHAAIPHPLFSSQHIQTTKTCSSDHKTAPAHDARQDKYHLPRWASLCVIFFRPPKKTEACSKTQSVRDDEKPTFSKHCE
ncbi:GNAT family N-acetyltransferase [Legionella israelensis]|uniref:Protease synthase and sporulation negative regulatory protein PAI 1 n=1 Tax=Legionella israelensis TaxID=454 RepID=A0A0W0VH72_9GAMM|nr:GNAT family N-acetyltransferase [Legionella israelensis]KTD19496.1 Protease synthase and sporulation negative regulatory protein PAI 1 [Legionella israelensis]QBS08664.1 GNAT family N-acetyltransferase [Legionella israelensis]SCY46126.1 Ribosomal protein S18 acetylase RimI [Legionella israelensis DSM 19235]STX58328.1 Protease synthase and sporulation negative regulatory protein PAI 1 [Legionella israelensis]